MADGVGDTCYRKYPDGVYDITISSVTGYDAVIATGLGWKIRSGLRLGSIRTRLTVTVNLAGLMMTLKLAVTATPDGVINLSDLILIQQAVLAS